MYMRQRLYVLFSMLAILVNLWPTQLFAQTMVNKDGIVLYTSPVGPARQSDVIRPIEEITAASDEDYSVPCGPIEVSSTGEEGTNYLEGSDQAQFAQMAEMTDKVLEIQMPDSVIEISQWANARECNSPTTWGHEQIQIFPGDLLWQYPLVVREKLPNGTSREINRVIVSMPVGVHGAVFNYYGPGHLNSLPERYFEIRTRLGGFEYWYPNPKVGEMAVYLAAQTAAFDLRYHTELWRHPERGIDSIILGNNWHEDARTAYTVTQGAPACGQNRPSYIVAYNDPADTTFAEDAATMTVLQHELLHARLGEVGNNPRNDFVIPFDGLPEEAIAEVPNIRAFDARRLAGSTERSLYSLPFFNGISIDEIDAADNAFFEELLNWWKADWSVNPTGSAYVLGPALDQLLKNNNVDFAGVIEHAMTTCIPDVSFITIFTSAGVDGTHLEGALELQLDASLYKNTLEPHKYTGSPIGEIAEGTFDFAPIVKNESVVINSLSPGSVQCFYYSGTDLFNRQQFVQVPSFNEHLSAGLNYPGRIYMEGGKRQIDIVTYTSVGASTLHVNETFAITGEDNGTSFCIQDLSGSSEWRFTSVPKQNRVVQYLPMIQR